MKHFEIEEFETLAVYTSLDILNKLFFVQWNMLLFVYALPSRGWKLYRLDVTSLKQSFDLFIDPYAHSTSVVVDLIG